MAWARIDDAFDDHPKVLALLDMDGAAAAIGLWTLCLTYAHRNTRKRGKTPGLIPFTLPRRFFGAEGRAMAGLLVEVGLWDEVEDGWMIHDFAEYLPAKEVSAARSEAGKKGAAKRWGSKSDTTDDKPVAEQKQDDGKLPFDDDSWPSDDDNAVASDGSRAGAHRGIPVPGPVPIPPTAGTATPRRGPSDKPINAGDVIAAYMDGAKEGGQPAPAETLRSRVGKQARTLLADKNTNHEALLTAAHHMGAGGWQDLAVQMQRDAAAKKQDSGSNGSRFASGTGARSHTPTAEELENAEVRI